MRASLPLALAPAGRGVACPKAAGGLLGRSRRCLTAPHSLSRPLQALPTPAEAARAAELEARATAARLASDAAVGEGRGGGPSASVLIERLIAQAEEDARRRTAARTAALRAAEVYGSAGGAVVVAAPPLSVSAAAPSAAQRPGEGSGEAYRTLDDRETSAQSATRRIIAQSLSSCSPPAPAVAAPAPAPVDAPQPVVDVAARRAAAVEAVRDAVEAESARADAARASAARATHLARKSARTP